MNARLGLKPEFENNPYEVSTYKGDSIYHIDTTGDACVGDEVKFEMATFTGSHSKPKFNGFVIVEAKIINDSYGKDKQQHTFTLLHKDGTKQLIKGRNLYRNGLFRKPWKDENERNKTLEEKHLRGSIARSARYERKNNPTRGEIMRHMRRNPTAREQVVYLSFDEAEMLVDRIAERTEQFNYSMSNNEKTAMAQLLSDIGVKVSDLIDVSILADNYAINAEIVTPNDYDNYDMISVKEEALFSWEEDGYEYFCLGW
jgi:hypothetical protein